jgi:hypothetical protein
MNKPNKFDGKVGKHYYRAGRTCGTYNLFRRRGNQWKFWKTCTNVELVELKDYHNPIH